MLEKNLLMTRPMLDTARGRRNMKISGHTTSWAGCEEAIKMGVQCVQMTRSSKALWLTNVEGA